MAKQILLAKFKDFLDLMIQKHQVDQIIKYFHPYFNSKVNFDYFIVFVMIENYLNYFFPKKLLQKC